MRDLALKTICGHLVVNVHNAGTETSPKCVPFDCELVGVAINMTGTPDVAMTWDVLINGSASAFDIIGPAIGQFRGVFVPDGKVFLNAGDRVSLTSNQETTVSSSGVFTYIFRPLVTRPASEVWLDGENVAAMETANTESQDKCVPFACEVMGVAISFDQTTDAANTLDVYINGAEQVAGDADVDVPTTVDGGYFQLDRKVYVPSAGHLRLRANGEDTGTAVIGYITYVIRPDGPHRPSNEDILTPEGGISIDTGASSAFVVAPSDGYIKTLAIHNTVIMDEDTDFDIEVNGASQSAFFRLLDLVVDEFGAVLELFDDHDIPVKAGDIIEVTSSADQVAVTAGVGVSITVQPTGFA